MAAWGELRRPRQLEEENRKLKELVADLSLDKLMLQGVLSKSLAPGPRRELVRYVQHEFGVSQRRGCVALRFECSSRRYRSKTPGPGAITDAHPRDCSGAR